MNYQFVVAVTLTGLLVTGCSSNPKSEPKYDEIDLMRYKICLEVSATYNAKEFGGFLPTFATDKAIESCTKYLPVKK